MKENRAHDKQSSHQWVMCVQRGYTAILLAVEGRHTNTVEVLTQAGANLETRSNGGRTPIMLAADGGDLETVKYLAQAGANTKARDEVNNYLVHDYLWSSSEKLTVLCVVLCCQNGRTVLQRTKWCTSNGIISCYVSGHPEIIEYLTAFERRPYIELISKVIIR